jgi:hypothetical protein
MQIIEDRASSIEYQTFAAAGIQGQAIGGQRIEPYNEPYKKSSGKIRLVKSVARLTLYFN